MSPNDRTTPPRRNPIADQIRRAMADGLSVGEADVHVTRDGLGDVQVTVAAGGRTWTGNATGRQVALELDRTVAHLIADAGSVLEILHAPPRQPLAAAPDHVIAQVVRDIMTELDVPTQRARRIERLGEPALYWEMIRAAAQVVANAALWRREYVGDGAWAEVPK